MNINIFFYKLVKLWKKEEYYGEIGGRFNYIRGKRVDIVFDLLSIWIIICNVYIVVICEYNG